MPETDVIVAISASIVTPILAYLKVREERMKTSDKRDAKEAITDKRLSDLEEGQTVVVELKETLHRFNVTLTRVETILEIYVKNCDSQCAYRQPSDPNTRPNRG